MKSERRHELEHNELADWLNKTFLAVKPYQNLIFGVVILLLAAFLVYSWLHSQSTSQAAASWGLLYKAIDTGDEGKLNEVMDKNPKSAAAQVSALWLADNYLRTGCDQLFVNKDKAELALDKAIQLYQKTLAQSGSPQVSEQATFGLARAYESEGKLTEATKSYEDMLKNWPKGAFVSEANDALARLGKQSTKAWYDRFARFDPKPAAAQSSTPSKGAKSPLDTIPEEAPLFEPGKTFGSSALGKGAKTAESTEPEVPAIPSSKSESTPPIVEPEKTAPASEPEKTLPASEADKAKPASEPEP
jgi:tetratricopeptide (TPR) repeat protein